jgi:hypothetical protein
MKTTMNTQGKQLAGDDIVDALSELSQAIHALGNNHADTRMGGMEALGKAILEGSNAIASGLRELAEAIRDTRG